MSEVEMIIAGKKKQKANAAAIRAHPTLTHHMAAVLPAVHKKVVLIRIPTMKPPHPAMQHAPSLWHLYSKNPPRSPSKMEQESTVHPTQASVLSLRKVP